MTRILLAIGATLFSCATLAAIPPMSESELQRHATAVVVGTVTSIRTMEQRRDDHWVDELYEITVSVETVEHGTGVQPGLPVVAHGWQVQDRPFGWTGAVGIYDIEKAKVRSKVRLHLIDDKGTLNVIAPNGLALVGPSSSN